MAEEMEMDLVEISPNAQPPVCRIVDYQKFLYQQKKREKERKAISGIQKLARERAKKASLHNKKLRDCRIHYGDKDPRNEDTMLFITEGDSASGSITKSRDVNTQAVFSLRGKPANSFGMNRAALFEEKRNE